MANLTPQDSFDNVPQLERSTLALGGPGGPMNSQAQALLNRTERLRNLILDLTDSENPQLGLALLSFIEDAEYPTGSAGSAIASAYNLRQDLQSAQGSDILGFSWDSEYRAGSIGSALQGYAKSSAISSLQFDLVSSEEGRTDPAPNGIAWEQMRQAVIDKQATVVIFPGTYILPPGVRLDADYSTWLFMPGALLKLQDAQVSEQDFIVSSAAKNQIVIGLTFDANRAAQDGPTFGPDRCGVIVVDPTNCKFYDTHIVSSPAKGFAVVGSEGGTVDGIVVVGVTGGNCQDQAVLFDGNNMLSNWRGENFLDRVFIGDTSHAGVAINDGAHNITTGLIVCDVNNSVWDAVSLRDVWNIRMTTTRGSRGRNGVHVFSLNTVCRDIDLGNAYGDRNFQSGVAILGCSNVQGATVGGKNNAVVGLNIQQVSILGTNTPCRHISISNPVGFDDRATKVQQYGLLVGGADDVSFASRGSIYGNTVKDVSIIRAAGTTNVDYPLVKRVLNRAITVSAGGSTDVELVFDIPFEDDQYDVSIELRNSSSPASVWAANVTSKSSSSVIVHIVSTSVTSASGFLSVKCTRQP